MSSTFFPRLEPVDGLGFGPSPKLLGEISRREALGDDRSRKREASFPAIADKTSCITGDNRQFIPLSRRPASREFGTNRMTRSQDNLEEHRHEQT